MREWILYIAVIGFCLGIAVAVFVSVSYPAILACLLTAFGVALVWRKNREATFAPAPLVISVLVLMASLGALRVVVPFEFASPSPLATHVDQSVTLEGIIAVEPDLRERTQHLYIETDDDTVLVITDRFQEYRYGDRVSVTGTLTEPAAFETDLGRTFNYPGFLQTRGVAYTMLFSDVSVIDRGHGNPYIASLLAFKARFMSATELVMPEPAVGLGAGLLLGVKQALGEELTEVFRQTGIIHIVVLSGYNVSLVVVFVMYVLSFVLPFRAQLVVGLGAIISFALLVGLSATVVRASVMAGLILMARYFGRTYAIMRALLMAGLLMLLINPYLLTYDVGFQLSFLATMGLILLAPHVERFAGFMPATIGLREFLVATIATQIFVLPILLYQIGELSIVSVIVNVLVLPMVPVAMLLTFVTGMLALVSPAVATPVALVATGSLNYILLIAEWFARVPFAAITVPAFPFVVVPVAYSLLAYCLWRLTRPNTSGTPTSDLSHWTIVTEEELLRDIARKKSAAGSSAEDPAAPPVFFR